MRRIVLAPLACALLIAGCGGGGGKVLTLRSVEAAVRAAGFTRLRVVNASIGITQFLQRFPAERVHAAELRRNTPDWVTPRALPVIALLRYTTIKRAESLRKPYGTRVCNVVVLDVTRELAPARHVPARLIARVERVQSRILTELRRRC